MVEATSDDNLVDVSCPACQEEVASCKQCQDDLIRAAAAGNDSAPEPIPVVETHPEVREEPVEDKTQEEPSDGLSIPEENKRKKGQLLSYQPTISGASVDHQTPQSDSVPSSAPDAGSSSFKKIEPPTNIKPTIEGMSTSIGYRSAYLRK